jgi:hypothetical protein
LIKCSPGGCYREIGLFIAGQRINANHDIMSWTAAIKGLSGPRRFFSSVDPKVVLKWFCRKLIHRP